MQKFWGDNFFDPTEKKFTTEASAANGDVLPRCFVQFIMKPIIMLTRNCMGNNFEAVFKMLGDVVNVVGVDAANAEDAVAEAVVFVAYYLHY